MLLDTDELKLALRARKVSGAFEKQAPKSKLIQMHFYARACYGSRESLSLNILYEKNMR